MIALNSEHLHLLWDVIETHGYIFQGFSDDDICAWLLQKIKGKTCLDYDEMNSIKTYILSRSHLIREVASS